MKRFTHPLQKPDQLVVACNPVKTPLNPDTVVFETRRKLHVLNVAGVGLVKLTILFFGFLQVLRVYVLQVNSGELWDQYLT